MADSNSTKSRPTRSTWLVPLGIFVLALSVRLLYLHQLQAMPTFEHPIMDEKYHLALAERINSPEGFGPDPYFRAPLYPYFFAFLYKITSQSLYWPRVVQIVLGSFLPLLVYLFGLKLFRRKIAAWSAIIAAVYPTFLYYDASLLITSLEILLMALLVWQLYRCQERLKTADFALAGVLLGLAGLARPNFLLTGPVLIVWVWLIIRPRLGTKPALRRFALMGVTAVLVILPVTLRNYVASGDPVFIAWQGGFNFYLGNNRLASGWSATVPGIDFTWEGGYRESIAIAEQSLGRELKRSEVSDFWYDLTFKEIRQDPSAFVLRLFKKLRLVFNGYEIPNNQDIYFVWSFAPWLRPLMFAKGVFFPFGIVAPLGLLGLAWSLGQWRKFLIVYIAVGTYIFSLLLFFICARYRQPIIPFLILFAVFAADKFTTLIREKKWKALALPVVVLAGLMVESNHDLLGLDNRRVEAESRANMGLAYLEQDKVAEAYNEFEKSVTIDPTFGSGYTNLGIAATRKGNLMKATEYFTKAVELEPAQPDAYGNLANNLADRLDFKGAVAVMERALQAFPNNPAILYRLATAYLEAQQITEGKAALEQSLRLDPTNLDAQELYREVLRRTR